MSHDVSVVFDADDHRALGMALETLNVDIKEATPAIVGESLGKILAALADDPTRAAELDEYVQEVVEVEKQAAIIAPMIAELTPEEIAAATSEVSDEEIEEMFDDDGDEDEEYADDDPMPPPVAISLTDDAFAALYSEIDRRQAQGLPLPYGTSSILGAEIGEICRDYLSLLDLIR